MTIHDLFVGLERCAPGDAESLSRACAGLAKTSRVLDAGCGNGADLPTLLTLVSEGQVTAIDLAEPFIGSIRARFPKVRAQVADMTDPPGGPYDLIWSGGAIYGPGVIAALTAWRDKLAPGGRVAFTDLLLRGHSATPAVADFFAEEGLVLRGVAELQDEVAAAGWQCLDGFWLPESAWADYYLPLELRLDKPATGTEMAEIVANFRREIALWRQHGAEYGYYLIVAVPL